MTKQHYLSEAARYDRLYREACNQIVSTKTPEYYRSKAEESRILAASANG